MDTTSRISLVPVSKPQVGDVVDWYEGYKRYAVVLTRRRTTSFVAIGPDGSEHVIKRYPTGGWWVYRPVIGKVAPVTFYRAIEEQEAA